MAAETQLETALGELTLQSSTPVSPGPQIPPVAQVAATPSAQLSKDERKEYNGTILAAREAEASCKYTVALDKYSEALELLPGNEKVIVIRAFPSGVFLSNVYNIADQEGEENEAYSRSGDRSW